MFDKKKSAFIYFIVIVMVVSVILPIGADAATTKTVQPRASYYLSSYNAYVTLSGSQVSVYFDVEGTGRMDELGALNIEIWESTDNSTWTWKKSFTHDSTSGMLGYNDFAHSGHVTYQGVEGRYYKAYVCVWAGKAGSGDTRYFWTSVKPTSSN